MKPSTEKILNLDPVISMAQTWRAAGEQVVFTNGCFDIIHLGHVDYLEKAALLGTKLVVGLNSDDSVKRLKGKDRPINNAYARARVLAALGFVDAVCLFEHDTPLQLIEAIKPHVLVKGGDYEISNIVGAEFVQSLGGKVETIPLVNGYSTTGIINKSNS